MVNDYTARLSIVNSGVRHETKRAMNDNLAQVPKHVKSEIANRDDAI
jgi:hypothetical protein